MNTKIISTDNVWIEGVAVNQFNKASSLPGVASAVAFPDLHPGKGIPIGAAYITENIIYPHLIGNDIGCGIGLWQTSMKAHKLKLDRCVSRLENFSACECDAAMRLREGGLPEEMATEAIGTIGSGNHFAELHKVESIENDELFDSLGLDKKRLFVMVHCGSRALGSLILSRHVDKFGAGGLDSESESGRAYIAEHDLACRWAKVNRKAIADKIAVLSGTDIDFEASDTVHNAVTRLGESRWLHRKGAAEALNSPVAIAGSRGDLSYLVMPVNSGDGNAFSLAHGAGRKWRRTEVKGRLSQRFRADALTQTELGSRVICHDRELLYEEAPQAYKRIETVIDALKAAGLIEVIAVFCPLVTYKKGVNDR